MHCVLVPVPVYCETLEALFLVDAAANVVKDRIYHLGGGTLETVADPNIGRGLQFVLFPPIFEGRLGVLRPALVYLDPVEFNDTCENVLGAELGRSCLVGQIEEGYIIDVKDEDRTLQVVIKGQFPWRILAMQN